MALSVGDLLGNRYSILKHLGRGSWGDVYLAEDRLLARKVAVKHLRPGSVRGHADVERFLTEARTIARIRDESVVTIYDIIEGEGKNYYLVLEYADEGTVADQLQREGHIPVQRALELGMAAAQALEVVHAKGILHGDIKPSNILLMRSQEGHKAKLGDFGLARVMAEGETDQGAYSGSILYAAPEQLREEAADGRADLYALGAVLYEMLTGQPPFPCAGKSEDVAQVIQSHLEEPPLPPSQLNPDVSPAVDELILKALNKTPDERYPDARVMGQALRQAIEAHRAWQERVETAYAQGLEHEQHRNWERAIPCFEAVLAEQPSHADAQRRLEKARERRDWAARYKQGLQACDQGDWAAAEKILSEIVTHDEGYAGGDAVIKLEEARRQRELERCYQEAQEYETDERWSEAIDLYLKILTLESDYRDVPTRLTHAIGQQKRQALYNKARDHLGNQAWAEAVKTLQELERLEPEYKDSAALLTKAQQQKRLHDLYTQAVQALNQGEWTSAIEAFDQVLQLDPEYKDAAVKQAIARRQARLTGLYEQARAEMAAEEWVAATRTLQEIKEILPSYQDVDHLLQEALQKQRIAELYQEGVHLYEQKEWEQAIQRLEELHQLQPGYRGVEHILEEARSAQRVHALYDQARQFEVEEKWAEAIGVYSQILQLDPNHRDAKVGLARVSAAALGRERPSDAERRERNIAVIGAMLVIVALSCMLFLPLSRIAGAIFPSATPTMLTATPSVTSPVPTTPTTLTPTPSPTSTPTPTGTPTFTPTRPIPTTATPTQTPSLTLSHTPSPTPITPTPTSTPTPTRPTNTKIPAPTYPPPVLGDVSIIACNVTFRWSWPGSLAENEYFAVRIGKGSEEPHSRCWTKNYEHTHSYLTDPLCGNGPYSWEIAICRGDPALGNCEQLAVSKRGEFQLGGCPRCNPTPTP